MSFSSEVKNQLCRIELSENCCKMAELAAIIGVSGYFGFSATGNSYNMKITTENAAFARSVFSSIKSLFGINPEIVIRKSKRFKKHTAYTIIVTGSMGAGIIINDTGIKPVVSGSTISLDYSDKLLSLLDKQCCTRSFLRGAFLAGGSISDPEKTYHLEISGRHRKIVKLINKITNDFGLNGKIIIRKGNYVMYLKEGENIVDFLNIIGAHNALLDMENVRILKQMRNDVNRLVNCETANLEKTVVASVRQIENIKYISENIGLEHLPENLRIIAELRLKHQDANLKELGQLLDPPLGKSGVNHRLRKLEKIAEEARQKKGKYKEIITGN